MASNLLGSYINSKRLEKYIIGIKLQVEYPLAEMLRTRVLSFWVLSELEILSYVGGIWGLGPKSVHENHLRFIYTLYTSPKGNFMQYF